MAHPTVNLDELLYAIEESCDPDKRRDPQIASMIEIASLISDNMPPDAVAAFAVAKAAFTGRVGPEAVKDSVIACWREEDEHRKANAEYSRICAIRAVICILKQLQCSEPNDFIDSMGFFTDIVKEAGANTNSDGTIIRRHFAFCLSDN